MAYDVHHPDRIAVALRTEPYVLAGDDAGRTFEHLERINDQNFAVNLAFADDRLVMGPGGSSYFFTDLPTLIGVDVEGTIRVGGHRPVRVPIRRTSTFDPVVVRHARHEVPSRR